VARGHLQCIGRSARPGPGSALYPSQGGFGNGQCIYFQRKARGLICGQQAKIGAKHYEIKPEG